MTTLPKFDISYHQERLWFIDHFEKGSLYQESPIYHNVPLILELTGTVDVPQLQAALHKLVANTEVLQTSFCQENDEIFAVVNPGLEVTLEVQEAASIAAAHTQAIAYAQAPFDLSGPALLRARLYQTADSQAGLLVIAVHSILIDKPSMHLLAEQLLDFYQGAEASTKALAYTNFAQWQKKLPRKTIDNLFAFWKRKLHERIEPLDLFNDTPRANIHVYAPATTRLSISAEAYHTINRYLEEQVFGAQEYFFAIYKLLLHNYCRQESIICGIPQPNRAVKGTEALVGPLANLLPINTLIDPQESFAVMATKLSDHLRNAVKYQALPFEQLVQMLNPAKDMARTALFDVLYQYEAAPFSQQVNDDLHASLQENNLGWGKYDLNLQVTHYANEERYEITLCYNQDYYSESLISRFTAHFGVLTEQVATSEDQSLSAYPYITAQEQEQIIHEWNDHSIGHPDYLNIVETFQAAVAEFPDRTAISFADQSLSYKELDALTDTLAAEIATIQKAKNKPIGIVCDRSLEMIVGIIGIIKSGSPYLPMDPTHPQERLEYILEDSHAGLMLQFLSETESPIDFKGKTLQIDLEALRANPVSYEREISSQDLAYILYTSGTTGKPKGVIIRHEQVVRLYFNDKPCFDFSEHDVWSMFFTFAFDFSVWEIWGALFYGAELVIPTKETIVNTESFARLLVDKKVTILNQTPTAFYNLSEAVLADEQLQDLSVRSVVFGGEELKPARLADFKARYPQTKLINMYGITETTVHSSYKEITTAAIDARISNVGIALPTVTLYLLDAARKLVPAGVPGEIYVGGSGLAQGYWNKEELTNERFIDNPFLPGERIYKSGDLAKWHDNGELEFIGRIDKQVQLRGFRIELDEVTNTLAELDGVEDVYVCVKGEGAEQAIYAYLVANRKVEAQEAKLHLAGKLPGYMIPSFVIQVDAFSMTPNGKLDTRALPDHEATEQEEHVLPQNKAEEQLLALYAEVLGMAKEQISTVQSFFDLGGHSLNASALINKIRKEFGVKLPISTVFSFPEIISLSQQIEAATGTTVKFEKAADKDAYALAPAQRRIYILQNMDEDALLYNITNVYQVEDIDTNRVKTALAQLTARHESLRTSFIIKDDVPVQEISAEATIELEELSCADDAVSSTVSQWIRPFDLTNAPLMRAALLSAASGTSYLVFDLHHIITDGVSNALLIRDFAAFYNGDTLPAVGLQYRDFSEWQHNEQYQAEVQKSKDFWHARFAGEIPTINLPTDYKRPTVKGFDGDLRSFRIPKAISGRVLELCKQLEITPYSFLLTAYNIMLRKITGQEDIVIGSPSAGRNLDGLDNTTGVFINVVAHRNSPKGDITGEELLRSVHQNAMSAFEHQDYQFEALVDDLVSVRDTSRNPLFDVMFDYHNEDNLENEIKLNGFKSAMADLGLTKPTAMFDLNFHVYEHSEGFRCDLDFATQLFEPASIEKMVSMLRATVEELALQPTQLVANIDMLPAAEKAQVLYDFNDTALAYDEEQLMHQGFEARAAAQPDAIAVSHANGTVTYAALNALANQVAHALIDNGLQAQDYVAITMDRSVEMVATVIGVLKAGGTYVPIEPYLPETRISTLIDMLSIGFVVTTPAQLDKVSAIAQSVPGERKLLHVSTNAADIAAGDCINVGQTDAYSEDNPAVRGNSEHYAYVIFTSGSTGVPKGVIVKHRPVININQWVNRELNVTAADKLLFVTSIGFDLSVFDIFGSLAAGASIRLATREELSDPEHLLDIIVREQVTIWDSAPAAIQQLLPVLDGIDTTTAALRLVMLSGDWIPVSLPDILRSNFKGLEVVSLGGATEATIWSNYYRIGEVDPAWPSIPYGKPIQNAKYYILDQYLQPCPIGIAGDLYIGGEVLASGYVGDEELTNKKFIDNPFAAGEKIYMTGDTARWFADGNMEFLGRKDNQVKIRGHRIELGEVESCFRKVTGLAEMLAIPVPLGGTNTDKQLCIYYVAAEELEKEALKEQMGEELPPYMIPTFFVRLDEFPVNQNGKVDRKNLPEPSQQFSGSKTDEVLDAVDQKVIEICASILGIPADKVGINDNFFELGGHSLNSTSLLNKVQSEFGYKVPLVQFFRQENLRELAQCIKENTSQYSSAITPVATSEYYALSSSQKRMLILHELDAEAIDYSFNIPLAFSIEGKLDIARMQDIFRSLIERHESLRTSFHIVNEEPVQQIHEQVSFGVEELEVNHRDEIPAAVRQCIRAFNLQEPPLLRVGIVFVKGVAEALVVDMHHIISDGVSQQLLIGDFMKCYMGEELSPINLTYKDFATWQNDFKTTEAYEVQKAFWLNEFAGEPQYLKLPADYQPGNERNYKGNTLRYTVPKGKTSQLNRIAAETGGTLFSTLLSSINLLLAKLSGQRDITIGTVTSGRNQQEVEDIVGLFLNTLPLRNYPVLDLPFHEFVKEVSQKTLAAFDNQDYQYEDLVNSLRIDRNNVQNPLFNVVFILQNMDNEVFSLPALEMTPIDFGYDVSKMDLTFVCTEKQGQLNFDIEYSTALFAKETAERFISYFDHIISQICASPSVTLGDIEVLSVPERDQILQVFNNTKKPISRALCYHELFEQQVSYQPKAIAAIHNEQTITYNKLNRVSNQIAHYLIAQDVQPGEIVALCFERGLGLLAGIMGVLKTGASYVAIDDEYPLKRSGEIVKQSESRIALVQRSKEADFNRLLDEVDTLQQVLAATEADDFKKQLSRYSVENPGRRFSTETIAYLIYTSGTTGVPKGIMVHQLGMLNHMYALISELGLSTNDVMAQTASCSSDIFVVQLLLNLITGGAVSIVDKEAVLDPRALYQKMKETGVTHMEIVPSLLTAFLETMGKRNQRELPALKAMLSMGEAIKPATAQKWYKLYPEVTLYNCYGPAEASDDVSMQKIDPASLSEGKPVSIGKPLENLHIYIMDEKLKLCPVGVRGEICVSGIAVGKGYWKEEAKTKAAFVDNPLYELIQDEDYKVLYKTGDIGYWQEDGSLIFDNRKDHMVKIRGFRVEPGDIENAMLQLEQIKEVAVIDRAYESGTKYLCAYFVSDRVVSVPEVKQHLLASLPNYMVPTYFVQLEKLPITQNDKIDRKALPAPNLGNEHAQEPTTETEASLLPIWKSVLGVEKMGTDQGFFDFGGDSIKAINLQSKMLAAGFDVEIKEIYQFANIKDLAARVDQKQSKIKLAYSAYQQKYIEHTQEGFCQCVETTLLELSKPLTEASLDNFAHALEARHPVLSIGHEEWQKAGYWRDAQRSGVATVSRTGLKQEELAEACKAIKYSFDLYKTNLILAYLEVESAPKLYVVSHPITLDQASVQTICQELDQYLSETDEGLQAMATPAYLRKVQQQQQTLAQHDPAFAERRSFKCLDNGDAGEVWIQYLEQATVCQLTEALNGSLEEISMSLIYLAAGKALPEGKFDFVLQQSRQQSAGDVPLLGQYTHHELFTTEFIATQEALDSVIAIRNAYRRADEASKTDLQADAPRVVFTYRNESTQPLKQIRLEKRDQSDGVVLPDDSIYIEVVQQAEDEDVRISIYNFSKLPSETLQSLERTICQCLEALQRQTEGLKQPVVSASDFDYKELSDDDLDSLFD